MPVEPPTPTSQAAAVLAAHPWIAAAYPDEARGLRIAPEPAALTVGAHPGALVVEFLDHWSELYDATYAGARGRHADDLDLSGWRATDTGQPLPTDHMTEWVDRTVALIRGTGARHVLELGCGTGLLMHRLHPHLTGYVGTDVAEHAVATLSATAPPTVRVLRAAAHELAGAPVRRALHELGFPGGRPDCVVLNSVTQCFPTVAYLTHVVATAIDLVAPGGAVVVGDVRHAGLHEHFCRWAERAADPDADAATVAARATARAAREEELLVGPATIAAATGGTGRVVQVGVYAKTMRADTELTRYRFDTVLHVDAAAPASRPPAVRWADLPAPDRLDAVRALLAAGPVHVQGVPNALLHPGAPDAVTAHALHSVVGDRGAVLLDPRDPTLLELVAPAGAVPVPAAVLAASDRQAHEPLPAFVRRRLTEEARRTLRRRLPAAAGTPVRVDLGRAAR
ncbi:class I SAM-dependent methyltransferase [Micromonospora sp. B11E3]|uniref:class I SAM-dependent methyltransferase n=1 Tax=Micromonospora sp. B11E3 TaxID=3153562 RepID=UPI00325E28AF